MDHAVFVDLKTQELSRLMKGKTTAIIRGAVGRQMPCDKVFPGEYVYFVRDLGDKVAVARGLVRNSFRSGLSLRATADLVNAHRVKLGFTDKEAKSWSKRKHVLLVELDKVKEIGPFAIEAGWGANGWTAVDYINKIRKD
jgi:hypothetical protein